MASTRSPRSRLTRPSIDRPKASRRGSPTSREARTASCSSGDGARVVRPVADHGAEVGHRLGAHRRRGRLLGQDLAQRTLGAVVARPQEVDVPHLGPDPGDGLAVAVRDGDALGLHQRREAGLVEAAEGVDEGLPEHQAGLDPVAVGTSPVGEPDGVLEGGDTGQQGSGGDGGGAGLGHRLDGGGLALARRARALPHREQDRRTGRRTELALGDRRPGVVLALGGLVLAGEPVELDQQGLVVLVQRAHHGGPDGQVARAAEVPTREEPQGCLVEDRLGGGRQPSSLGQQPRLVRVGVLDREAVEQLVAQARELDGGRPVAADELVDVHGGAGGQRDRDRVTVEHGLGAERSPDLREAPPQRPEGVVGLARRGATRAGCASEGARPAAGTPAAPSSCGCGSGSRERRRPRCEVARAAAPSATTAGAALLPARARSRRRSLAQRPGTGVRIRPRGRGAPRRPRRPCRPGGRAAARGRADRAPPGRGSAARPNARSREVSVPSQSTRAAAAPGAVGAATIGHGLQHATLGAGAPLGDPVRGLVEDVRELDRTATLAVRRRPAPGCRGRETRARPAAATSSRDREAEPSSALGASRPLEPCRPWRPASAAAILASIVAPGEVLAHRVHGGAPFVSVVWSCCLRPDGGAGSRRRPAFWSGAGQAPSATA